MIIKLISFLRLLNQPPLMDDAVMDLAADLKSGVIAESGYALLSFQKPEMNAYV